MKLLISKNTYQASNVFLSVSNGCKTFEAYSYGWWKFVTTDAVGNVYFNNASYSRLTSKHQSKVLSVLRNLGIRIDFEFSYTTESIAHLPGAFDGEINKIKKLISSIRAKGSWRKVNSSRRDSIRFYLYRIRDIRNIRDNFFNKKPIPFKKKSISDNPVDVGLLSPYFKKQNGKIDSHGLLRALNSIHHYNLSSPQFDRIQDVLKSKPSDDVVPFLSYCFTHDLNSMIPPKDSLARVQLTRWLSRQNITRETLTTFDLDKMHSYLVNKQNRRKYSPSEATTFPIHPSLNSIIHPDMRLIKTDRDLRAEGRRQSHCIGSAHYIKKCLMGYQALNFKGYTFFLDPQLKLIETHGSYNSETPNNIRNEFMAITSRSEK